MIRKEMFVVLKEYVERIWSATVRFCVLIPLSIIRKILIYKNI